MRLIGYYNKDGYEIVDIDKNVSIYSAGNSPYDSQQSVNTDDSLSVEQLKTLCQVTLKEIAEEHGAKIVGVERRE